jgi:dTMP kinase
MGRGRLIVLEGVDGAGTTTQASRLQAALRSRGFASHVTREPSDGPVGTLIRQALTGRLVVPGRAGPRPPRMETMALLFAADRVDHLEAEILPNLGDGITVISDRYVHSSLAYQTVTAPADIEDPLEWVRTLNARARRPDLILLLQVSSEEAARRRQKRGGPEEMYESAELQRRLAAFYSELPSRFPDDPFVLVDGERSVEAVHEDCLEAALDLLEEGCACEPLDSSA